MRPGRDKLNITFHKIKQYCSTSRVVICVDGQPFIITRTMPQAKRIVAYINGAVNVDLKDGAIIRKIERLCKTVKEG